MGEGAGWVVLLWKGVWGLATTFMAGKWMAGGFSHFEAWGLAWSFGLGIERGKRTDEAEAEAEAWGGVG